MNSPGSSSTPLPPRHGLAAVLVAACALAWLGSAGAQAVESPAATIAAEPAEAAPTAPAAAIARPTAAPELARGRASWYGPRFHGRRTSSGERFDMNALTAAHPTLPFGTRVLVRNIANGREVIVRINDRLPRIRGRIIDLSKAAAAALGFVHAGEARVQLIAR